MATLKYLEWVRDLEENAGPKLPPVRKASFKVTTEDAVKLLKGDGVLKYLEHYAENCYLATPCAGMGWGELSRRLSLLTKGGVWAGGASATHNAGGRKPCNYLLPRSAIEDTLTARKIVLELTEVESNSWSLSGNARKLLDWSKLKQKFTRPFEKLLDQTKHHFYDCTPGELGHGYTHDITSAYYSIACLAPSPYVILNTKSQPEFLVPKKQEKERWLKILHAVKDCKKLRNILIGVASRSGSGTVFRDGKESQGPSFEGVLRPLALLIIRSCFELCAKAQEEELQRRRDSNSLEYATYANTDNVISLFPSVPEIWRKVGLPIKTKAQGKTEIYSLGCYRVGDRATRWYWRGSRFIGNAISTKLTGPSYLSWMPTAS